MKVMAKTILADEKKYAHEIEVIKGVIAQSEKTKIHITAEIKAKDKVICLIIHNQKKITKEYELLESKLGDLKKALKENQLPPLELESQGNQEIHLYRKHIKLKKAALSKSELMMSEKSIITNVSNAKKIQGISKFRPKLVMSKIMTLRKDERGKPKTIAKLFDDMDVLKDKKGAKIIGLKVWQGTLGLSGFQAFYRCDGENLVNGIENLRQSSVNDKTNYFLFDDDDFITQITGFIDKTESYLQALILYSAKGVSEKLGEQTNDSKLFKYDVAHSEYPVCFYGAIEGVLCNFEI